MTEPQPWPTTVQRRRGSGEADPASGVREHESPGTDSRGTESRAGDSRGTEISDFEIPTPRHGRPAERPGSSPSPFPRARGAESAPAQAPVPGHPQPTHVRDLVGPRASEPSTAAPQARRARPAAAPAVVARDSRALTALRVITYLLVSLASLVFLAAVVYGGIRYAQLRDAFSLPPFGTSFGSPAPDAGARPAICDVDPASSACRGGG